MRLGARSSIDLSAIADGQQTLYLRWTMGPTDDSWQYCGWNIDDVEIWGLRNGLSAVGRAPGLVSSLGNHPNPFNPVTRIEFTLENGAPVLVTVFDVQGRKVRTLLRESLPAGSHWVLWDGTDDGGRQLGSGVYFARLSTGSQTLDHKMVLIK